LRQGKLQEASANFEKVLELAPESDIALEYLAAIMIKNGKKDDALQRVQIQVEKFPESAPLQILYGGLALSMGKDTIAEQSLRRAIELAPKTPKPYILLASIFQKTDRVQSAIDQYRAALVENPDLARVRMQLATLIEKQGNVREAANEYKRILSAEPEFAPAANNLAWFMAENSDDLGEAFRLAMVAKSGAPDDPYVADTVGWVHYQRQSYGLAKTQFMQALEKLETNPTVQYHLALTLNKLEEKEKAVESLEKAISLAKDDVAIFPELKEARQLLEELSGKG
jgi:Tfp pilus assembly protein PilF